MLAVYTGHEALTFPDYLDLETGRTLHAEPGETYDIAPASGRAVPDVPEGWFTVIRSAPAGKAAGKENVTSSAGEKAGSEPDSETE